MNAREHGDWIMRGGLVVGALAAGVAQGVGYLDNEFSAVARPLCAFTRGASLLLLAIVPFHRHLEPSRGVRLLQRVHELREEVAQQVASRRLFVALFGGWLITCQLWQLAAELLPAGEQPTTTLWSVAGVGAALVVLFAIEYASRIKERRGGSVDALDAAELDELQAFAQTAYPTRDDSPTGLVS